jgi:hypothetical protein
MQKQSWKVGGLKYFVGAFSGKRCLDGVFQSFHLHKSFYYTVLDYLFSPE